MKSKYPKLSQDLRIWRKEAGITQDELARRTGISYSSICKYETGVRSPKTDHLYKILEAVGIDPGQVEYVEGEDKELFDLSENDLVFIHQEITRIIEELSPKYARKVYDYLLDIKRLDDMERGGGSEDH